MNLVQRAEAVEKSAAALLKSPAAFMLPAPVRALIGELCALVSDLAKNQTSH